jgi:hypothetical protein
MIPVAARCKAWVYGRSLVRTAGSNRIGDIVVCCVVIRRYMRRAYHSSHNSPRHVPLLNKKNPIQTLSSISLWSILILPSNLRLSIPRVSSLHLPHHKPLSISPLLIRATCPFYRLHSHVGATAWLQLWMSPTALLHSIVLAALAFHFLTQLPTRRHWFFLCRLFSFRAPCISWGFLDNSCFAEWRSQPHT